MRLTSQLMRSRASRPLHCALVIDLSHLNLVSVERLELCPKLQTLNMRGNRIESVQNLDCCRHLWKIDLANNKLRSLEGLCRFPAFGTLILSNNYLDWNELQKIRHMHILDLSLHGNPILEMDAYYRLHVIDSLPNVWMLDGRIITSAERNQVRQFFKDSALSDRPVRHKLPKNQFVPTSLKNIAITGVHGCRTDHLMRNFPNKMTINIDIDKRRLLYLAYNLQQDVNLEIIHKKSEKVKPSKIIEYLINCRKNDQERCNMVLLLLVGSLEFSIPLSLVQHTLEVARLSNIEKIQTIDLFMFSRETRCRVVSLLLSAVKIERDQSIDGGLYNRLYLALYDLVADIIKLANGDDVERYQAIRKKMDSRKSGYRSLLASEIVQLLCIVPVFFDFIGKDPGVMDLISIATKHSDIGEKIRALSWKIQSEGADINQVYQTVSQFLLEKTKQANALSQSGKGLVQVTSPKQESDNTIEPSYVITSKRLVKTDRPKSCIPSSQADKHSSPQRIPRAATAVGLRNVGNTKTGLVRAKTARRKPRLGDRVQLGHQACGRLVALPENHVGLVQLDTVAASRFQQADHQMHSKFDNQFHYVNFKLMEWDYRNGKWRIVSGVLTNHTTLPVSHKQSSVESRENARFLSEALQQTLKLRVDLPLANKTQIIDTEHDGPKALITDHVRSIVKECLEEAEVCWTDAKPEILDENWNEPERTESPGPQSEVTVQIDSESHYSGKQEIAESEEPFGEEHLEDRSHSPIPKATPMLTSHMIQMYQPNTGPVQRWQQNYHEELVSQTENERLNAWSSSEAMKIGSSTGLPSRVGSATLKPTTKTHDPPPQRPTSPAHTIAIKQGNSWLAGGRDVSASASVRHMPSTIPGWMEELETSRRPKSCSGTRQQNKPIPGHASWSHFSRPFTATRGRTTSASGTKAYKRVQSAKVVVRR